MRVLPAGPSVPAPLRPASAILHDEANVRIVAFHLAPGQEIPPHRSMSTVVVHVTRGKGSVPRRDRTLPPRSRSR